MLAARFWTLASKGREVNWVSWNPVRPESRGSAMSAVAVELLGTATSKPKVVLTLALTEAARRRSMTSSGPILAISGIWNGDKNLSSRVKLAAFVKSTGNAALRLTCAKRLSAVTSTRPLEIVPLEMLKDPVLSDTVPVNVQFWHSKVRSEGRPCELTVKLLEALGNI